MSPEDLINLLDEVINIGIEKDYPCKKYNKHNSIHYQISDSEGRIEVENKKLKLNEEYYALSLTPRQYPEYWAQYQNGDLLGDFFSAYRQIPCPFILSYSFYIGDQTSAKNSANHKMIKSIRNADSGFAKWVPSLTKDAQDWRFVADKLSKDQKLVRSVYHLTLFSKTEDELQDCERKAKSLYQSNGFSLSTEKYVQLKNFMASLPMIPGDGLVKDFIKLGKAEPQVSWTCSNLLPIQGDFKGNDPEYSGVPFFSRRGQIFFWDPFINPEGNYNTAVVGKSGSGKSFFMQELVANLRGKGGKVYIIDDGHSFEKSVKMLEGQFVEFSSDSKICINPFSMIDQKKMKSDQSYRADALILLTNIVKQMAHYGEKCSDWESGIIAKAVSMAWDKKQTETTITTVAEILSEGTLVNGNADTRITDIVQMLYQFTKEGAFGHYFEGKSTIELSNDLMAFELSEIKAQKELQSVVMMVIMFLVSESMYKGGRKVATSLVIDEAWDLLSGSSMSDFIEGMARRARKYKANLITGTQSINDYYKNPAALAAIENTDWLLFLAQKPDSLEQLNKLNKINFNEYQLKVLKSLTKTDDYSECCITGPGGMFAVGRVIIDPYSVILFSSKAEHYARVKELCGMGMTMEEAVDQTAKEFFGNKI